MLGQQEIEEKRLVRIASCHGRKSKQINIFKPTKSKPEQWTENQPQHMQPNIQNQKGIITISEILQIRKQRIQQ